MNARRNAVFLLFGVFGIALSSWLSRLPSVALSLGLDPRSLGVLIFGLPAGALVGLSVAPRLRTALRPGLFLLAFICAMATGLLILGVSTATAADPALGFAGLVLFGAGFGAGEVMINTEGAAIEQDRGRSLMPLFHAFFSIGTIVGSAGGAMASAGGVPVLWHLTVVAVVMGAVAALAANLLFSHGGARPRPSDNNARDVRRGADTEREMVTWKDRRVWLIGIVIIGMALGEGAGNDWITVAAVESTGASEAMGATLLTLFLTGITVVRTCGGPLLDTFGRVTIIRASCAVATAGVAAFVWSPWGWLIAVGVVLWGLGVGLGFPICMSAAADHPAEAAQRVGKVAQIAYLVSLAGPPLLGVLGNAIGIRNALATVLVLLVVSMIFAPGAGRKTISAIHGAATTAPKN